METKTLLPQVIELARIAGKEIMAHYKAGQAVYRKDDNSPVTEADRLANCIIVDELKILTPSIAVVSEEGEKPEVPETGYFWLVDPLDGTRSFIRGSGYFTVNIALVKDKQDPILGVIYDPVNGDMYYGDMDGAFHERNRNIRQIHVKGAIPPVSALVSHSHLDMATENYLIANNIRERIPCASSIKFCMLADGKADIYPRFGPTMEWDTAAGHAILRAAGGDMKTPDGKPFLYGKKGFLNGDFIAFS